jgi:hypothetical protein
VSSYADNRAGTRQAFWLSIARILVAEILVLVLLSAAAVAYLNWSSEIAFAEFLAASKLAAPAPGPSVDTARVKIRCERRG